MSTSSSSVAAQRRRSAHESVWNWLTTALNGQPVPPLLVVIGLGDGTLLEVLEAQAPQTRVLALEPDTFTWRRNTTHPRVEHWRREHRLTYLAGPDFAGADQAWRLFPAESDGYKLVVHPRHSTASPAALNAARVLKRIVFGAKANTDARRRFAPRYLVNTIRNLPALAAGRDARELTNAYAGLPAIVAGAGPSLDEAIHQLRARPDRGLIVAADTALRPLLAAGLAPHFIVGLDPGAANTRHFLSLPACKDTWLVAESALDPQAVAVFDERTFWFRVGDHHPWPWLDELGIEAVQLDVWGSVLTGALQVAMLAGCDPIVIVGADLAFSDGHPYARGTTYEFDWAASVAAGDPLEDVWARSVTKGEPAKDVHGRTTLTTRSMGSVRDWIVARAQRSGRRIVNASGAGTLFGPGIEQAALADILTRQVSTRPVRDLARPSSMRDRAVLAKRVRTVRDEFTLEPSSALFAQWKEFGAGGFDPEEVKTALDEAILGLETHRQTHASTSLLPWHQPETSASMAAVLSRLPEAVARRRRPIGDSSTVDTAQQSDVERAECLLNAWDLLGHICLALQRSDVDLQLVVDPAAIGTMAISSLYAWPDETRWAVVMFEGLLGDGQTLAVSADHPTCRRTIPSEADVIERPDRPNIDCACALLALDWLRAAGVTPSLGDALSESIRINAISASHGDTISVVHRAALTVGVQTNETATIDLRLSFSTEALALVRLGCIDADFTGEPVPLESLDLPAVMQMLHIEAPAISLALATRATMSMAPAPTPASANTYSSDQPYLWLRPRILTQEGTLNRLFIAYGTSTGVVCIRPHTHESVIVDERGVIRPYHTWPRAISGELPLGDDGVVAWNHGLSKWPDVEPAYVMYRRHAGDEVIVEELPYRPAYGNWVHGRLYWSCFSRIDSWQGVVSWAPGEDVREEISGIPAWGTFADGDVLVVHPCEFSPSSGFRRRIRTSGWAIHPGRSPEPMALGPHGAMSSRDTQGDWTAVSYPDTDIVRLMSRGGRSLMLACSCPLDVAWLGPSLLVGTLQGEILLFGDLSAVLEPTP